MYKEKLATFTTVCNVEGARYNYFIHFYFFFLFQAKAIALAAKNGKDVCVNVLVTNRVSKHCLKSYLHCVFGYFNIFHCQYLFR